MDLDLRKVRYFAAVAEHLNFGRAAEALHIAQPVLSRQIRALEHELKVQLFDRDNRSTRVTPAGEALLEDARTLLPAADATRRRVREVAAAMAGSTSGTCGCPPISTAWRSSRCSASRGSWSCRQIRDSSRRSALIHEYAAIADTLADHLTSE